MRPAICALALVAAVLVAATRASGVSAPRALAQAGQSGETAYGTLKGNKQGTKERTVTVDGDGFTTGEATLRTRVDDSGAGSATVRVSDVDVLDGLVSARSVRRASDGTGVVTGLVVEGQAIGTVADEQTVPLPSGGKVVANGGKAGLRVKTDTDDVRIAIAAGTTRPFPTPTPSPSPSPTPSPKPARTAAPTASPEPAATAKPKRKQAPKVPKRLTSGGYAFPVYGRARVPDTFGATRAAPVLTHQGVDIFAPFGSPVVAVRDGRLSHVGTLPISGNRLWLHTANGDAFFYAHLSAFAKVARNGQRVKAGQVLGFTGNTGDAEPTPPHVHFEVHPGGMDEPPVDPYPIVTAWQDRDDVPPGAWLQQLGADATERPGALVTVRDFIAE